MTEITTALQFSGGKDSRAILHMFRHELDKIVVVWLNTGAAYPEVEEEMRRVSRNIPHFLIVRGNQPKNIAENGYPSDVVPIRYTPLGRACVKSAEPFKIQSAFDCCHASIWLPLHGAMKLLGIKTIIRGQRKDEEFSNSSIRNGDVVDGIQYLLPIEDWTEQEVYEYLHRNNVVIPQYYNSEPTSHDCWDCTAYMKHNVSRIRNLPKDKRAVVEQRLAQISQAVRQEMAPIEALLRK